MHTFSLCSPRSRGKRVGLLSTWADLAGGSDNNCGINVSTITHAVSQWPRARSTRKIARPAVIMRANVLGARVATPNAPVAEIPARGTAVGGRLRCVGDPLLSIRTMNIIPFLMSQPVADPVCTSKYTSLIGTASFAQMPRLIGIKLQ